MDTPDLILRGYFPKELPPPFVTQSLFANLFSIMSVWNSLSSTVRKKYRESRSASFSIPRLNFSRRIISIPNPLHQIELSEIIASHWRQLNRFAHKSRLSASVPVEDPYIQRALIPKKTFTEYKRAYVLSSHDRLFEVRTDISRFYPSIYTHSISWALHTKPVAKRKRNDLSLLGNKLDKACRACQSGQTIGLPIGPDTSFLISEIIATAIDVKLCTVFPDIKGYRYIDDYHLFLKSQEEAERVLKYLQSLFGEYELDLNDAKTDVVRFPQPFESSWTINLSTFKLHDTGRRQRRDISNYFSLAFEYHNQYPKESVIRYAVKRLFDLKVDPMNWKFFQSLLLKTTLSNPLIIPDTLRILLAYESRCNKRMLHDVVDQLLSTHLGKWHSYEIAWTLWLAKSFRIRIHKKLAEQIFQSGDQFPILISFDMMDNGLVSDKIDTSFLGRDITAGSLFDENWLFTYEMITKKWLKPNKPSIIEKDPFFKILHETKVIFYDQQRQMEDAQIFLKLIPKTGVKPRMEYFAEEY